MINSSSSPLIMLFLVLNSTIIGRMQTYVIPLYISMRTSYVNTEYSIHRVQCSPSTACTEYCIHHVLYHSKINSLSLPASLVSVISHFSLFTSSVLSTLPSFGGPCCTQLSTFPQLRVKQSIESPLPSRLPPDLPSHDGPLPSTLSISIDDGPQVHLWTCSITASNFASSSPPSASPNSLDHALHICTIMAPNMNSPTCLIMTSRLSRW